MSPSPLDLPGGCSFRLRCPRADEVCKAPPQMTAPVEGRLARCFHPLVGVPA
jgi:peptide/nickel transport system ATP-binding protein